MLEKVKKLMEEAGVEKREVLSILLQAMAVAIGEEYLAEELNRQLGLEVEEQDIIFLISYLIR